MTSAILIPPMGRLEQVLDRERRLIDQSRQGSEAARRELFMTHRDPIAGLVQRMTGDPGIVDDLVQEVFIAAFQNLHRFRGDSKLRTWLHRIAVNKVRSWWDSDRRRNERERENHLRDRERDDPTTPEENVEASEHRARLYRALEELPSTLREAFVVRVIEGLSLKATSELLSIPVSTASYRARRAEELLFEAMGLREKEAAS